MGNFYTNIIVNLNKSSEVFEYMNKNKRAAFIYPETDNYMYVYDEDLEQESRKLTALCRSLTKKFGGFGICFMNHDDDVLYYWLVEEGKVIDKYISNPGYFNQKASKISVNSSFLSSYFTEGNKKDEIEKILSRDENNYAFEFERHEKLLEILGLDKELGLLGYEAIINDELENYKIEDFLETELNNDREKRLMEKKDRQTLKEKGILLKEIFSKGRYISVRTINSDEDPIILHGQYLIRDPGPDNEGKVLYSKFPFDEIFEFNNIKTWGGPSGIDFDKSGRYVAFGNAYGNWTTTVYDLKSGEMIHKIPCIRYVHQVKFFSEAKRLLAISEEYMTVIDVESGVKINEIDLPYAADRFVIHPDEKFVITSGEKYKNSLLIFNSENLELIKEVTVGEKTLTQWSKNSLEKLSKQQTLSQSLLEYYEKRIQDKEFANHICTFRFDSKGEKLIISTTRGIFIYKWDELIQSQHNTVEPEVFVPAPKMEFDNLVYCYSLELDEERNTVLYSNSTGLICYYDMNMMESGILLELVGEPYLTGLTISKKNNVLICSCGYKGEDRRNESPEILVFKYPLE